VLDEQPLLRCGISTYLNSQPDMMVCGEAESLLNARSKIAQCQPQLVLTGLRLGTGDSLKSIKKLKPKYLGCASWCTLHLRKVFLPSAPCVRERVVT